MKDENGNDIDLAEVRERYFERFKDIFKKYFQNRYVLYHLDTLGLWFKPSSLPVGKDSLFTLYAGIVNTHEEPYTKCYLRSPDCIHNNNVLIYTDGYGVCVTPVVKIVTECLLELTNERKFMQEVSETMLNFNNEHIRILKLNGYYKS